MPADMPTPAARPNGKHLVWIDLEMTGLEPENACFIIEIATIDHDE